MRLKILAVITLLVLGTSFASPQTFGFASVDGGLYCNYEQLEYSPGGLWGGEDNLTVCGVSINSQISGFSGTVTNHGEQAYGAGVTYGDSIYAVVDNYSQAQLTVFTKLKCNAVDPKTGHFKGAYGWIAVTAFTGPVVGTDYGYLSCTIPSKADGDAVMRGMTIGKIPPHKK